MSSSTSEDRSDERVWSEDDFREFLGHDDPEIREWALRKLGLRIDGEPLVGEYRDSQLPGDTDLLKVTIAAGAGELAAPLFEALDALDEPDERGELLEDTISRAGGMLVDRRRLETLEWRELDEIEPVFRPSYELADLERQRALREAQVDAVAEGDWSTVADSSLEMIELLTEAGLDDVDSPSVEWTTACARALRDRPSRLDNAPEIRAARWPKRWSACCARWSRRAVIRRR